LKLEKGIDRRGFFKFLVGKEKILDKKAPQQESYNGYLKPPGAVEKGLFLSLCNGCGDCADLCSHRSIKMEGGFPVIAPKESPCYLCDDFPCVQACQTGALTPIMEKHRVKLGIAVIKERDCMAWGGGSCQFCFIRCPLSGTAIILDDFRPLVIKDQCTGCGVCEYTCATVNDRGAIKVVPIIDTSPSKHNLLAAGLGLS
jgi:ferredoxin-type protein NapG